MRRPLTAFQSILVAASLLGIAGCGGPYDAAVNGVVTLAGNPLPRGTVSFMPQTSGPPAYGQIESDGKYLLSTGRAEGLISGAYTVTVTSNEPHAQSQSDDGGPLPLGKPITPAWYADPATSGLVYTVESGDNEINIELKSTPPPGWKPPPRRR